MNATFRAGHFVRTLFRTHCPFGRTRCPELNILNALEAGQTVRTLSDNKRKVSPIKERKYTKKENSPYSKEKQISALFGAPICGDGDRS